MPSRQAAAEDIAALAGLRRLVVHSRDQLQATRRLMPADGKEFAYNKHLEPAEIRRHVAHLLALDVLTLVADCLPSDGGLTADEADQLRAEVAAASSLLEREREARAADAEVAERRVTDMAEEASRSDQSWTATFETYRDWLHERHEALGVAIPTDVLDNMADEDEVAVWASAVDLVVEERDLLRNEVEELRKIHANKGGGA